MNATLTWYGRVLWLGIFAQLAFGLVALGAPDLLGASFYISRIEFSYVWLGNMGMLLLPLSMFSIAAARDPARFAPYAWLAVVEKLVVSVAVWARFVMSADYGKDFVPLLAGDGALAVLPAILLQLGLPEAWKLGSLPARIGEAFRAAPPANAALLWFRRVSWVGAIANLGFIVPAMFAPQLLRKPTGPIPAGFIDFSLVWLAAAGAVLLGLTLMYLPAALAPERRPGATWLAVVSRLIAVVFWANVARQPDHGVFVILLAPDLVLGVVQLGLLQVGMAPEHRIGAESLRAFARAAVAEITLSGKPVVVRVVVALAAVLGGAVGVSGWYYLVRQVPDAQFASDVDQFKYGSIGLGMSSRVPTLLWRVLPTVCADKLPDAKKGWASLGLLYEEGKDVPVGFSQREIGFPSLEANCALCHSGSYRPAPGAKQVVVPSAPAHQLDLQRFQFFLYDCASDPKFTTDNLLLEIEKPKPLGLVEKLYYRLAILPLAKSGLLRQKRVHDWQSKRPMHGPGRTDTFNPTKIDVFYMGDDGTIGTTDLPQVWNQKPRENLYLHWDGNNNQIRERNYAAAMAIGATPTSVLPTNFKRVTDFLLALPSPAYPFPIDQAAAARGKAYYDKGCADCHSFQGAKIAQSTPEVGTDTHRLLSFTQELVDNFHKIDMPPFKFDAYRKTQGYANVPIDGIWMRGPFLHHGAVPTLWDLLQKPEQRPKVFYTGHDVFDPKHVGFVSQGPEAEAVGWKYDTSVPGNGNGGHLYGTDWPESEKLDLLEYLKTL